MIICLYSNNFSLSGNLRVCSLIINSLMSEMPSVQSPFILPFLTHGSLLPIPKDFEINRIWTVLLAGHGFVTKLFPSRCCTVSGRYHIV